MLERIKTVLLVVLVTNSIFLTGNLWTFNYSYEQTEGQSLEEITYGDTPNILDQIKPHDIMYRREAEDDYYIPYEELLDSGSYDENNIRDKNYDDYMYLFYEHETVFEQAWDILKAGIEEELAVINGPIQEEESIDLSPPYLVYRFGEDAIYNLLKSNEYIDLSNHNGFQDILVTLSDNPKVYLANYSEKTGTSLNIRFPGNEISNFKNELQGLEANPTKNITSHDLAEIFNRVVKDAISSYFDNLNHETNIEGQGNEDGQDNEEEFQEIEEIEAQLLSTLDNKTQQIKESNLFEFIPDNNYSIEPKVVRFEHQDQEKLAKAFFLDLSFVRRIEERDGTSIFTDGQRGLRFYPHGAVQYDAPQRSGQIRLQDPLTILERGGRYISLYGGWSKELRLSDLDIPNRTVDAISAQDLPSITYNYYYTGLPIIDFQPVEIELIDSELVEFYRRVPESFESLDIEGEFQNFQKLIEKWLRDHIQVIFENNSSDKSLEKLESDFTDEITELSNLLTDIKRIYPGYSLIEEREEDVYIYPAWILECQYETQKILLAWGTETLKESSFEIIE